MAILGYATGNDRYKGDSAGAVYNSDAVRCSGTGITIDPTSYLAPGNTSYKCDVNTIKVTAYGDIGMQTLTGTETLFVAVMHIGGTYSLANMATQVALYFGIFDAAKQGRMDVAVNGASTTTILAKFYYDNIQIGANQVLTIGNTYRIHVYIKQGTLGTASSTFKVYLDDVTSTDIAVGAATNVISTTTATFTNAPTNIYTFGFTAANFSGLIYYFQHMMMMDTAGSDANWNNPSARAVDPLCATKGAFPKGAGNYQEWTSGGTFTDVDEAPPDDVTTVIAIAITSGTKDQTEVMDVWANVGNSSGDVIGAVRIAGRGRATLTADAANLRMIMREGGTDVRGASGTATGNVFKTIMPITSGGGLALQLVPPSGGTWTPGRFNGTECGMRETWLSGTPTGQMTQLVMDAYFVKNPALVRQIASRLNQAVNRAATF